MAKSTVASLRPLSFVAALLLSALAGTASADLLAHELSKPLPGTRLDAGILHIPTWLDRNRNHVADRLEQKSRLARTAGLRVSVDPSAADLMICLDHAPTARDVAHYRALGATTLEKWCEPVCVVRARFPADRVSPAMLSQIGQEPGVVWVEENAIGRPAGYFATRQTRARAAWAAGGEGDPNQTIAILDTGIDPTHPDLAARLIGWADFAGVSVAVTGDEYPAAIDRNGHGTAVAGLAAGSGAAAGMTSGVGGLNLTIPIALTSRLQETPYFPVDTTAASGPSSLTARLTWQDAIPGVYHSVRLVGDRELLGNGWTPAAGPQPFDLTVDGLPSGLFSFFFQAIVGTSLEWPGAGGSAWLQVNTPMSAPGDERALMRGMAPGCKIAAVKTRDDSGDETISTFLNGVAWLNANRRALNLVCVNHAGTFPAPSPLVDAVVNQMVRSGIVWVEAAGNDREGERDREATGDVAGVFSPGSAAKAITVGATNEADQVTNYSSYGREGQRKPDLLAPGGSNLTGRLLVSVDSNSADLQLTTPRAFVQEKFPDDYTLISAGTSLSAAQVAGAAMLVAQAMGEWSYTEAQALRVKSLLLMTASETGVKAEPVLRDRSGQNLPLPPDPVLNRGEKDRAEGYGRLNVDAAVDAVRQSLALGTPETAALGPGVLDRKVWARSAMLTAGTAYTFILDAPANADHDLYLYADTPAAVGDSDGEPQIVASSTRAGLGGAEVVAFTPSSTGRFYAVVKYVAGGAGEFRLSGATAADFALSVSPGTQALEAKGERVRYSVSVTALGDFREVVSLAAGDALPAGVSAEFDPPAVKPGGSSVLTVQTSESTPSGSLLFTITGAAPGAPTRSAALRLEVGAIWPRFHHDGRSSGRTAFNGPQTTRQAWRHDAAAEIASSPAIGGDGTIYYGARDGSLTAIRAADGATRWSFFLPSGAGVNSSPAIGIDGTIYFGADDGRLYALRPDGSPRWQQPLGTAPIRSSPAIGPDGTLYVAAGGALHAVRPDGTRKWRFSTDGTVNSSPSLGSDGTIYFGIGGAGSSTALSVRRANKARRGPANRLVAIRDIGASAQKKWEFPAAGKVLSSPLVAPGGRIYFGAHGDASGGRLYVITDGGASATRVAAFTTRGAVQSSPAIGPDGSVYVGCDDGSLYAFDADGRLKWRFPAGGAVRSSPAVGGDGLVYVGSEDGRIYALRDLGGAGELVWSYQTGGAVAASPAIGANGALYVPSLNGSLYAFLDSAAPGFLARVTPQQETALVGDSLSYTVQLQALAGFGGDVAFAVVGALPPGVTPTFEPARAALSLLSGTAQVTLRLATTGATPAGEFRFRVRATSGDLVRETNEASAVLSDYALVGQPGEQRVTAGRSATFSVLLVPNPIQASWSAPITLTATVLAGSSAGRSPTLAIDTPTVTAPAMAAVTVTTTTDTAPGVYAIEVQGASAGITRTLPLRLVVEAP